MKNALEYPMKTAMNPIKTKVVCDIVPSILLTAFLISGVYNNELKV
ncbi:hypothetical protein bmyco0001_50890 [Bacillus mycoides DSM 2048]|nr:hypothetical protein bmyco0001_50890 [Bacillus mycoides DSM 2048]